MNEEIRCYTFTHFMLSSIQQGIQSGHAATELSDKYMLAEGWQNGYAEELASWISNHKTIICLNGGNSKGLHDLYAFLGNDANPFPFVKFHEDEDSMEGILTSIALILPARIFDGAARLRRQKYDPQVTVTHDHLLEEVRISWVEGEVAQTDTYNGWEHELMEALNRMRLAT